MSDNRNDEEDIAIQHWGYGVDNAERLHLNYLSVLETLSHMTASA